MSQPIIEVKGLSKFYRLGEIGATSLKDEAERLWHRVRGGNGSRKNEDFWALRDVSFDVQPGEVLGIIGRNGAGKSTLLKILSRITQQSSGEITLRGRVASLLEVGTGFHPDLSGRENIFLNGAILGMTKAEIRRKLDEIVAFAEIEKFIDTPVKRYSSGMYVRLAFAVAAHLEPEILIVDEVLAVGDSQFQKKCLGKMQDVSNREGRTVLFVSHQMGAVSALCQRAILLDNGRVTANDHVQSVVPLYLRLGTCEAGEVSWANGNAPQNERIRFHAVRIKCEDEIVSEVPLSSAATLELEFEALGGDLNLNVSFHLLDHLGNCIFATGNVASATLSRDPWGGQPHPAGRYKSTCEIPANFLNEGRYGVSAFVVSDVANLEVQALECLAFQGRDTGEMRKEYTGTWIGAIRPKLAWRTEKIG